MSAEGETRSRLAEVAERVLGRAKVVPIERARARREKPTVPTVNVSGNGHVGGNVIVGNGNTVIVRPVRKKVIANIQPGSIHISETQAARLKQLVGDIAAGGLSTHQGIWTALQRRYTITTYRLLPAASFEDAEAWLVRWIARVSPTAATSPDRNVHIRYIKTNQTKLQVHGSALKVYLSARFGKTSLTECTVEELIDVRKVLVPQWRRGQQ